MASAPKDEEVRSVIRSILVSNPNEMSAFLLDRDFREMEGYSIPYSRFGYKSLLDYLYSIPDTVTVKGSVVLPVTTEKAAHVEKMVLKQKSSTSHRRQPPRRSRNHGVSRNRSMGPPPPRPSHERTQSTHQATTSIPSIFDLKFDPLAMEKLKGGPSFNGAQTFNDTSLVANGPLRNYSPNVNNPPFIPAYPFSNNNSMPQAQAFLPNVSFQPSRPNEPRWNQPNVCAKNNSGLLLQTVQPKPTTFITSPKDSTGNNNASWAKNRKFVNAIPAGAESSAGLDQFSSGSRSDDESAGNDYESCWGKKSGAESYYARSAKSDGSVINDYADSPISIKMQENFEILLKKYPDGFFCSELPGLYENEFHAPFSCQDYGYNSIIQMVSDHPGIFSFSRFEKHGDWLLKQPGGIEEKKSEKSMKRWLPRKIIQNITRILEQFPGGLPISQLLVKYKEFVNETLDFGHYGESLQVVIDDLENYVHQRRVGDDILLYEASRFKKSDLGISENLAVTPALPNVEMSLLHKDLYPKECCSHDDVIPVQKLLQPTDSHYIKVLVSDLENPYNLWFQLGVCYNALRTMMNDLHEFYSRHESKYVMPELTIRPRQLCACVFPDGGEEKWHRAIILTCQKDQIKVLIEYIDYGTRMEVSRTILRFLHKDFSKLPCQAIKGRLSGVYPQIGCTDWPKVVNLRLRSLTIDRWLMIEVVKERDGVIEVFLYDTSTDEDIVVNDELISSGHARGYDEQLDNSESLVVGAFASYLNSPNSSVKSEKSAPWNCSPDKQTSIDTSLKVNSQSLRIVKDETLINSPTRKNLISLIAKKASTLSNGVGEARENSSIENSRSVIRHRTTSITVEDLFKKFANGKISKDDTQLSNSSVAISSMSKSVNSPEPLRNVEEKLGKLRIETNATAGCSKGTELNSLLKTSNSITKNGAKSLHSPISDCSTMSESDDSIREPSKKKVMSIEERIKAIADKLEDKPESSNRSDCNLKTFLENLRRKKRKSLLDFMSKTNDENSQTNGS